MLCVYAIYANAIIYNVQCLKYFNPEHPAKKHKKTLNAIEKPIYLQAPLYSMSPCHSVIKRFIRGSKPTFDNHATNKITIAIVIEIL